ncbi:MAG: hypothetical protein LBK76_10325 [Verrucomicrobiales bacterium]|jgi:hypothetical protein|nr:hypothetical protein [Verrucomicrobiales bacterium]
MKKILAMICAAALAPSAAGLWAASPAAAAPGLTVKYQAPRDASVSLGLFDAEGHLLRWLQQDELVRKGAASVTWDGLDQWGEPLPVGNYVVKGVSYGPLGLEHAATVNNPGTPPWPTADGKGDWLADESTPMAAATDGKWVFLGAPGCEDGFGIIAVDEHGQRQWGWKSHTTPRSIALAVDGDYLYAVYSGPGVTGKFTRVYSPDNAEGRALLYCFDKHTGRMARFSLTSPSLKLATWPYRNDYHFMWEMRANKSFTPANNGGQPRYSDANVSESTNVLGIAALKGKLYVGFFYDGKVVEYDAETAEPTGLEIPVPAVVGLHAYDDHTVLAVSENQVVKIDLARKVVESFIVSDLVAPAQVTSDRAGNVYVSDWKDSFQVKQFDQSGKFVKAIGKAGGRPWLGKFDPDGMILPRGVAVTDEGKLWVAEDDTQPRRVSVWDTASGKLARDYIGPANYGGGGYMWLDLKDKTKAVSAGVLFDVDYATKTGAPLATLYRRMAMDEPFVPNGADTQPPGKPLLHGKDEFVFICHDRSKIFSLLKRENGVYKQAAAVGYRFNKGGAEHLIGDGTGRAPWDSDVGYHCYEGYYPEYFKGKYGMYFSWTDADGDRRARESEVVWTPAATGTFADGGTPPMNTPWYATIDREFTIYFDADYKDCRAIFRLPVKEWLVNGAPSYDLKDAQPIIQLEKKYAINGIYVTRDNKMLVMYSHEWAKGKNAVECYDLEGKLLWASAMPARQEGKGVHGTGFVFDYDVPGLGVVCSTWSWHGSWKTFLFTTSGDYIGAPLTDNHDSGPFSAWGESFRGGAQYGDELLLLNGASQSLNILKIRGLERENVTRFEFPYKIDPLMVARAETFRNQPKPRVMPPPVLRMTWANTPLTVDGQLDDWPAGEYATLDKGDGRKAEVALARDQENLYLAYKVYQTTPPLRNEGADWQKLFMTGDCVDLLLRTGSTATAADRGCVPGDRRLLLSVFNGKPVAVLYEPVADGEKKPVAMMGTTIDRVTRLDAARVACERNFGDGYYVIEAAVPLTALGLDPGNHDSVSGDAGVIFADASGRNRALRLYYYNHSPSVNITEDLTTEASLQPGEWGKIQLPLGENLIKNGGFEAGFAAADTDGWIIWDNKSGCAKVELDPKVSHSGRQSVSLRVTQPLDIPDEAFKIADFGAFLKAAKNANPDGRIAVGVRQKVPVIAGHKYSLRYSFIAYDMQQNLNVMERGKRGFATFSGALIWNSKPTVYSGLGGAEEKDREEWLTVKDYGAWFISQPFVAPVGATEVTVNFNIDIRCPDRKSEVWLDSVEMTDLTERDGE